MNFGEIRNRIVQHLGEYQAGAAEAAGVASLTDATIYERITDAYRDLIEEVANITPERVLTTAAITYTANAESVALAASLVGRDIRTIERLVGSDYVPLDHVTLFQDERARQDEEGPGGRGRSYGWRVETGTTLFIMPKPTETLTLRARYVPAQAAITTTDAASTPSLLPVEHHPLIAAMAALSFKREVDSMPALQAERDERMRRFRTWVSRTPRTGPRFVRETYDI